MIDFKPDLNPYNKFNELSPFKFHVMASFPYIEADFDALNEYKLLTKVVEYLNNTIKNMNIAEENISIEEQNIQALYNAYSSLQDYVNNYFDNLDVQDEINNKLNDMAQDGSLLAVITPYLQPIIEEQNGRISNIFNIVQSVVPGTPKGVYERIEDLRSANPDTGTYIITANGHIYSWTKNASNPIDLGVYQATGLNPNDPLLLTNNKIVDIINDLFIDSHIVLSNGNTTTHENWCCSDFIDIFGSAGAPIIVTSTVYSTGSTVWYDENKNVLGYINGNNASDYNLEAKQSIQTYELNMPDNARYIKLSALKAGMSGKNMSVIIPRFADANTIKNNINNIKINSNNLNELNPLLDIIPINYTNLIDPSKYTENMSVSTTTGELVNNNSHNATDYIYLKPNTTYYVGNVVLSNFYAFYNVNKEFITNADVDIEMPTGSIWSGTITTHETPYYFRGSNGKRNSTAFISDLFNYYRPYSIIDLDAIIDSKLSKKSKFNKVLVLGDSISTDYYQNYKKWVTDLIEEGFLPNDTNNSSIHATGFVARYNNLENDFISRITAIENKSSYDLVVVFGGINDYISNVPFGDNPGETSITTYFKPAVDYFFNYLIENFNNARIIILSPLRTYATYRNQAGKYQTEYAQYIRDVAKSYCLPILNLTEESGFMPFIQSYRNKWTIVPAGFDTHDGVHPNEEYEKEFLAPMIKNFINLIK